MNREILFRGKRVDNGEWVYGDLARSTSSFEGKEYNHVLIGTDWNYEEVIPETIGQFTGLTDKSGTKIFEGDQYETDSWPGIEFTIKFVNGSFCGGTEDYGYDPMGYTINQESETIELDYFASNIKITGTIHDNPTT